MAEEKMGQKLTNTGNEALIEVRQLRKIYKTPAGEFHALKGIDLQVNRGEFVGVIGKSGSGKSTFINILTGIDRSTSGEIWIDGTAVHELSEVQLAQWRGQNVGIVFQFFQLLPTLTLIENIILAMDLNNKYKPKERKERAMNLLELVKMEDHARKLPSAVSGGQQQRVAIARALANDPMLIIADEPTGNLDSKTAEEIFTLFEELVAGGKTMVMVTHDDDLAKRVDRTIMVADGEVVNEYLVRALSALTPDQLTEVTRKVETLEYSPGEAVIRQGTTGDKFYIIVDGEADVFVERQGGVESLVNHLQKGQYFGEMALAGNGFRTATVRAAVDSALSVAALDQVAFNELTSESRSLREELAFIIDRRQTENQLRTVTELNEQELNEFTVQMEIQSFEPDATILRQGDMGKSCYIIIEGAVEVVHTQPNGKETVLGTLKSGQYFGEMALLGDHRRRATVRVSTDTQAKVVELDKSGFDQILKSSKVLKDKVREVMADRNANIKAAEESGDV